MKKVILFDLGKTIYTDKQLLDAYKNHLYNFLAKKLGLSVSKAKKYFEETRENLKKEYGKHINKSDVLVHLGFTHEDAYEGYKRINPKEYLRKDKNLANLFLNLSERYTLGIITNDSRELTEKVLDALGIDKNIFSVYITYDNVKNKKPHIEPFQEALKRVKTKAGNCYYVADNIKKDLKPAKEVGMKTVWVTNEKRKESLADYTIQNLFELKKVLNDA